MYRSIFLAITTALIAVGCGDDDGNGSAPMERWQPPAASPSGELSIEPAGPIVADGVATFTIAFTLVDGKGRPLGAGPVRIDAKGGGNTVEAPSMTDAGGRATATLSSTRAETKQVTVAVELEGTWTQVASSWVEFGPGAVTDLSFSYVPSAVLVDSAFTVRVAAADENGNAAREPVEVQLEAEGVALEGVTTATTNGRGEAIFAGLRIAEPGAVRLVASSGDRSPVSVEIRVVPSQDLILSWRTHPADSAAGEPLAPLEVKVLDGAFRPLVEPIEVTLELPGVDAARIEGTTRVTSIDGVATFDDLRVLTAGRDFRFVATAEGAVDAESQPFTVAPGAPDAEQSFLHLAGARAGEAGQARVVIQDAFNNRLEGQTVALSSDRADVTIDPPTAVTDQWGEAAFSVYSTVSGSVTLVAAIGDWEFVRPMNLISANVPDPTRTVIVGDGQVGVPGSYLMQFIGLEFQDAWGNVTQADVELQAENGGSTLSMRTSGQRTEWAWRLGAGIGPQTVLAHVSGLDEPIVFHATAQSDWPFSTTLEQSETELLVLDRMPSPALRVRLRDDVGDLVADAPIEWTITEGTGTIAWNDGPGPMSMWTGLTGGSSATISTTESSVTVTATAPGALPAQFRLDVITPANPIACQYQYDGMQTYESWSGGTSLEGVYRLYADAESSAGIEVQARFVDQVAHPDFVDSRVDAVAIGLYDPVSLQANTLVIDGNGDLEVDGAVVSVDVGTTWTGHPLARLHRVATRRWHLEYDRAPGETDEVWVLAEGGLVTSAIMDVARAHGAGGAFGLCGTNDGSGDIETPRTGDDSLFP